VSNTVRISVFARRREIKIMQIVGAPGWFIRMPLLIEGLLHGLLGGALASACLYLAGSHIGGLIRDTVPMLTPYLAPVDAPRFGLSLLAAGALIGVLGSLVSISRYLRTV
jgi:cell division transport system permease protein